METKNAFLEVRKISKAFAGVQALDEVSIIIEEAGIHCLVGENGSGKSTLIKTIGGVLTPDSGEIWISGNRRHSLHAIDAIREGIQIIYQDLSLFPNMTVAENIALNQAIEKGNPFVRKKDMLAIAEKALLEIDERADLYEKVENLPMSRKQVVAICRAMTQNSRLIIMDEPTSAITKAEVDHLFSVIMRLKEKGIATLFVSHKLTEVFEIAEKVTILRDGKKVGDYAANELDNNKLTYLMTGRHIDYSAYVYDGSTNGNKTILEVRNLTRTGHYENVSFSLKKGEILGITGLIGSGRTEVALSLFGLNPPDSGEVLLGGKPVAIHSPTQAIRFGIGYLPEDRLSQGLFVEKPIGTNIVITIVKKILNRIGLIVKNKKNRIQEKWISDLQIKTPSAETAAFSLSGGNQQRVVLAKWLATEPKIFILDGPTIGIDIASKSNIHEIIRDLAIRGIGIIMISDEIPEILHNCNRVLVMRQGKLVSEIADTREISEDGLFNLITGREKNGANEEM